MQSLSSLPPFQSLTASDPQTKELLGPLFDFIGTWTNELNQGWNLIAVPGPVVDSPALNPLFNNNQGFFLETIPYIETITFTPIAVTLNRGSFVDSKTEEQIQQIGAVFYEQSIVSAGVAGVPTTNKNYQAIAQFFAERGFSEGTPIHAERGMLLNILNFQEGKGQIARMGTIPHGNVILCLGDIELTGEASPNIDPQGTSALPTVASAHAPPLPLEYDINLYTPPSHTPDSFPFYPDFIPSAPNQTLINANSGIEFLGITTHISLSSENSGGILNIPFVNQAIGKQGILANKMTADYWISKFQTAPGVIETRIQYVQNVNIVFPPTNAPKTPVNWPHIDLNTLYKKSD